MPVSRERFQEGLTPAQFMELVEKNRERFEQNLEQVQGLINDDDRAFFAQHPVSIVAIGEDWCTDVVQFFPVVFELAREVPSVTVRVFLRDQNHDLIDQYLKEGQFRSIPVFVLYDERWNELGHFIERPAAATQEMAQETRRFAQEHADAEGINRSYENMPDETRQKVRENSARFRWSNMLRWDRMALEELKQIASQGGQRTAGEVRPGEAHPAA